jgi:hypothetical protein
VLLVPAVFAVQTRAYAYAKNDAANVSGGSGGSMPAWVNVPSQSYPADTFFAVVGDGPDRQSAELKAVQGIASLFGQNVSSVASAKQLSEHSETDGDSSNSQYKAVSRDILQNVDQDDVVGVEIKEYWFDDSRNVWYVRAVLDKNKTASLYCSMIRKNNEQIELAVTRAEKTDAPMDAYAYYTFAGKNAETNDAYIKRLSVINPATGNQMRAESPAGSELDAKKRETAKTIPVGIDVAGDDTGRIAAQLAEVTAGEGFLTDKAGNGRYVITGAVRFADTENSKGTIKYCKYTIECALKDTVTGSVLIPYSKTGREGAGNAEEAKNRAVNALVNAVEKEFAGVLSDYLNTRSVNGL